MSNVMTHQYADKTTHTRRPPLTVHRTAREGPGSLIARTKPWDAHVSRQRKGAFPESNPPDSFYQHMFAGGFLVPSQFFTPARRSHMFWRGEQRLLFAVLQDAVACWFRYRDVPTRRGRRLFDETVAWFESPDKGWLYAFERICEILDLDSEYIRRGLQQWQGTASAPLTLSSGVRRRIVSEQPH